MAADPYEEAQRRVQRAAELRQALLGSPAAEDIDEARALLKRLRGQRAFEAMIPLADSLLRLDPQDHASRRQYAQALIETGAVSAALALLSAMVQALPETHPEWAEAWGLVGRCNKQIFVDAAKAAGGSALPEQARAALVKAVQAYARPYAANRIERYWHGVNLLALARRAEREGMFAEVAATLGPLLSEALPAPLPALPALAQQLIDDMRTLHASRPDDGWLLASLAEAALGQALIAGDAGTAPDMAQAQRWLRSYLDQPGLAAFDVASTLRQFNEVWGLGGAGAAAAAPDAQGLLGLMQARLLRLPGGALELSAAQVTAIASHPPPPDGVLEAVLGTTKAKTMAWMLGGVAAARAVAVIRKRLGSRLGSGFLVRARDLGLKANPGELLLLTNFHVVNREGASPGIRPDQAEVLFESVDAGRAHAVAELLWQSPVAEHDAALLRLADVPAGLEPLRLSPVLPARPPADSKEEDKPRVYIIGHPGGRELSISMADNALIDHEAPPEGQPAQPGVWRLHYRAPTEGGSSGSPVFNDEDWSVIALHHKGGRFGMPRLNGAIGTYAANEGLALKALAAAACRALEPG
jgi:Trypsin-like peptidase domain